MLRLGQAARPLALARIVDTRICAHGAVVASYRFPCKTCYPPAAPNAITPAFTTGTSIYTWTCSPGYYATAVQRTCQASTDAAGQTLWTGSPITCLKCIPPPPPTNGYTVQSMSDASTVRITAASAHSCLISIRVHAVALRVQCWIFVQSNT
jgi:hypothetical protein